MDSLQLIPLIILSAMTNDGIAREPVPEIISAWREETHSVHSVWGQVHVIRYDTTFHIQSNAAGEFGYIAPQHGYLSWQNKTPADDQIRLTESGEQYEVHVHESEHYRWHRGWFRIIDERNKEFLECVADPDTERSFTILGWHVCRTVDFGLPFLPGCPNKDVPEQWTYTVTNGPTRASG